MIDNATSAKVQLTDGLCAWRPIATAPRDGTPIVGWCVHAADPCFYGGHEVHVEDGPNVIVWGGGEFWGIPGECMTDWWFQYGSSFEVAANPTHWIPIPSSPTID